MRFAFALEPSKPHKRSEDSRWLLLLSPSLPLHIHRIASYRPTSQEALCAPFIPTDISFAFSQT